MSTENANAGISRLYAKLAEVLGEVGPVAAKGRNDFLKTSYVEEGDLFDAIRGKLAAKSVVLIPSFVAVTDRPAKNGSKDTTLSTATFDLTFCDGETGCTHTVRWAGAGMDAGDKGLTMAETNAIRTFLLKAFMVSSAETNAATVPGAGIAPTNGGTAITPEQLAGISAAFIAAGRPVDQLEQMLNTLNAPKEREGKPLEVGVRIGTLNTTEAISLHKKLAALPKATVQS
ncbi:MAG TPA: hypothetical protein VNJ54_15165 [Plantibacter sp.]|uniref:hypothetical protein n=1 Tax=Plantibacter sp. TaxID=1871045 RepID=UPI002C43C629|nr:hypothetical protein [Plantibacter sp.]